MTFRDGCLLRMLSPEGTAAAIPDRGAGLILEGADTAHVAAIQRGVTDVGLLDRAAFEGCLPAEGAATARLLDQLNLH